MNDHPFLVPDIKIFSALHITRKNTSLPMNQFIINFPFPHVFDDLENFHFLYNVEKLNNATRCNYWASYERGQIKDRVFVSAQQDAQIGRHVC